MSTRILFPFRKGDDNRNAFAFTIEMARRSNADISILTSLELSQPISQYNDKLEGTICISKDEIFCDLLEMKGYYHGIFNQWNYFDEFKIYVQLINNDMNGAICNAIKDHTDLVIVLQQKYFSGTGLYEKIISGSLKNCATLIILPADKKFHEPLPNLSSAMFHQQKRSAFLKLLGESKIYKLPEDQNEFRKEMIIQMAV